MQLLSIAFRFAPSVFWNHRLADLKMVDQNDNSFEKRTAVFLVEYSSTMLKSLLTSRLIIMLVLSEFFNSDVLVDFAVVRLEMLHAAIYMWMVVEIYCTNNCLPPLTAAFCHSVGLVDTIGLAITLMLSVLQFEADNADPLYAGYRIRLVLDVTYVIAILFLYRTYLLASFIKHTCSNWWKTKQIETER